MLKPYVHIFSSFSVTHFCLEMTTIVSHLSRCLSFLLSEFFSTRIQKLGASSLLGTNNTVALEVQQLSALCRSACLIPSFSDNSTATTHVILLHGKHTSTGVIDPSGLRWECLTKLENQWFNVYSQSARRGLQIKFWDMQMRFYGNLRMNIVVYVESFFISRQKKSLWLMVSNGHSEEKKLCIWENT